MQPFDYQKITKDLVDKGLMSQLDIYDFSESDIKREYNKFYQFCQNQLSNTCLNLGYKIDPSFLVIKDSNEINACARYDSEKKIYIIEINKGVVESLYDLMFHIEDILEKKELEAYKSFSKQLLSSSAKVPIGYLASQYALLFTFYHELGHLAQFSNYYNENSCHLTESNQFIEEQYSNRSEYSSLSHLMEYDADIHAANRVAFHILTFFRNDVEENNKNGKTLRNLLLFSLSSILCYIILLWDNIGNAIYYHENTHPHPIIRINWIILNITNTVFRTVGIDFDEEASLLSDVFFLTDKLICPDGEDAISKLFLEPMKTDSKTILEYIEKIRSDAEGIPFLSMNNLPKQKR